jgi:glutaredoxin
MSQSDSKDANYGVQIYTRPGCKFCRIAKAKLNELAVPYSEFDISISDLDDLQNIVKIRINHALTNTVPQIYVGSDHIGGCDNLLAEIDKSLFAKRLEKWNIVLKNTNSTTIQTYKDSEIFENNNVSVKQKPFLNMAVNSLSEVTLEPLKLSTEIQRMILGLSDKYVSLDGKKVNYGAMKLSNDIQQYTELASQLSLYSIEDLANGLDEKQRLCFFVNIYNAMIMHATCELGPPMNSPASRSDFFTGRTGALYNISGYLFSPDDIEHGILRANLIQPLKRNTSSIQTETYFQSSDLRAVLSLTNLDPRIHFVLNCGASSCPPIAVLTGDPELALVTAATSYLDSEIEYDRGENVLYLPKLLFWYGYDFAPSVSGVARFALELMSEAKRENLLDRLAEVGYRPGGDESVLPFEVKYRDYDWTPNESS